MSSSSAGARPELAAADALRREGFAGALTMISADDSPPCDRPNLSKDFLAGTAPPEWIPLRTPEFYTERKIDLILNSRVTALDVARRRVEIGGGKQIGFDALLLATGAEPVRLEIPGAAEGQVCYLRTFADSRAIVAKAGAARSVVVVGASFIGLEVAASLRTRGIEVHVVGPEKVPMARILGEPAGLFIQGLHESHGVQFHLNNSVSRVNGRRVELSGGASLDADFLVVGVGVRPAVALAEKSGLAVDRVVTVNEYLETSARGIFAAGDIARWPDPSLRRANHGSSIGWSPSAKVKRPRRTSSGWLREVRRGAVLLEPALRSHHQLCGPRRAVGRRRPGGVVRGTRFPAFPCGARGRVLAVATVARRRAKSQG